MEFYKYNSRRISLLSTGIVARTVFVGYGPKVSQLPYGVTWAERRDQTLATMSKFFFVCWSPGASEMWIEGYFAGLLERRVAQKQTLYIIQYGFLFLKVLQ